MPPNDLISLQCKQCGHEWMSGSADSSCDNCRMANLFVQLPPHAVAEADKKIFEASALHAIRVYKDTIEISLAEARDLYDWRMTYLKKVFPQKFYKK